jgi:hypothetical protein
MLVVLAVLPLLLFTHLFKQLEAQAVLVVVNLLAEELVVHQAAVVEAQVEMLLAQMPLAVLDEFTYFASNWTRY